MKKMLAVPALMVASALAGSGVASFVAAGPASATPTYFDQWPGNVVIDYQSPNGVTASNLQNYAQSPIPSLSSTFSSALQANTKSLCDFLQTAVEARTGQPVLATWKCNLASTGDLEAAQLGTNEVGLDYVDGSSFSFSYDGVPGGAIINAKFDLELTVNLSFADQVGGGQGSPVAITSSSLGISNASFSSSNLFVKALGGKTLKQAAQAMDAVSISPAANLLDFGTQVASVNNKLVADVGSLTPDVAPDGSWCGLSGCPDDPTALESPVFDLSATVDASNLYLVFSHGAVPALAPVGCEFGSSGATAPATVYAECSPGQPGGVTQLSLLQQQNGAWTILGPQATSGWAPSALNGVALGSWVPNAGPVTAYAPWMQGPQLAGTGDMVEVTVCSFDQWGSNCDPATNFTLAKNAVSDPPTAGGGGIVGPPPIKGRCGSGGNCRFQ